MRGLRSAAAAAFVLVFCTGPGCADDPTRTDADVGFDAVASDDGSVASPDAGLDAVNACGGTALLADAPGATCGPCLDGRLRCAPDGESLECVGGASPNACGGCGALPGAPGSACGPCGGVWACDAESGDLVCEGAVSRNECGGCEQLPGRVNFGCFNGIFTCDGPNDLVCRPTGGNACGGDADVPLDPLPGSSCGACGQGVVVCDGTNATRCADSELGTNACGGCAALAGEPETACGCSGTWTCDEDGGVECVGDTGFNACGGCSPLAGEPGDACTDGVLACGLDGALTCQPPDRNACGGIVPLSAAPGASCGPCGDGVLTCVSEDAVACTGASQLNACGSCGVLQGAPGGACGSDRMWRCRGGALDCAPAPLRNACGGTATLGTPPGVACGDCQAGVQLCVDDNRTECFGGAGRNVCGGCTPLEYEGAPFRDVPGAPCGVCYSGTWACDSEDVVVCSGEEPLSLRTYYADRDGDGFGSPDETRVACSVPLGFVENDDDCNDATPADRPGALERCDERDNDCDGEVDELFFAWEDADQDGFGTPGPPQVACELTVGLSRNVDDCDDGDPRAFPGQVLGFAEPRADGSWDFDCDGLQTPTLTDVPACGSPPLCGTDGISAPLSGWLAPVPLCGQEQEWILRCRFDLDCAREEEAGGGSGASSTCCTLDRETRRQECR